METAASSLPQNEFEVKTEEQVEKLVGDIGRAIRNAEPGRRAGLKELAETLLHEEIVSIPEQPQAETAEVTAVRKRANPLAAGILLVLLGFGLAIIVPFIGLTLAAIGLILVVWGAVISALKT